MMPDFVVSYMNTGTNPRNTTCKGNCSGYAGVHSIWVYAYQYCFIFKKIILIIFSYANLTLWWCDINDMHHQSLVFLISKLYHHDPNHHLKPFPSKWGWLWSTEGHERFTQTINLMLTTCRLVLSSEPRPLLLARESHNFFYDGRLVKCTSLWIWRR